MKYANDEELDYDPDAIEVAQHAREEEAWEQKPEGESDPGDDVTHGDTFYWLQPTSAGHEPTREQRGDFEALPDDLQAQYLGDRAAEMATDDDRTFAAVLARMARHDGVPGAQMREVVETASAWRGNEATADLEVEEQEEQEALAQPPYSAYGADPHQIDEQYWPAPEAEMEAGS